MTRGYLARQARAHPLRFPRSRARMQHDSQQAKRVRAIDLVNEGGDRLLTQERLRRCQVDEIAGVRDDRRDSRLFDAAPESPYLRRLSTAATASDWRSC